MDHQLGIVVVEDDYIQSYTLKVLLESLNYKVLGVADSATKAIEMAEELNPDLILMDIILNDQMDGIDAAIKIQESSDVQIIFITGTNEFYRKRVDKTRFSTFLTKPLTKHVLVQALEECLVTGEINQAPWEV
ncbi:MAG: response regulator [Balneolaceae bacterium]